MKTSDLIVPLSALLFSGAVLAQGVPAAAAEPAPAQAAASSPGKLDAEAVDLPKVPLTRDILYRLLAADLAAQRGHWKTAYSMTMRVAKQTHDPRVARRAAEIAIAAKQSSEAMAAVKLWHELAPHSEEATKYYLGFVLINDNLVEAKPILEQRLKEASPKVRAVLMFQIQRMLAGLKDKAKAYALLEELVLPYQATPEAHIALGQGALSKGDRALALAEAQKALAMKPDSELAVLTLAQASENIDQALQILSRFIGAYPKAREVRLAYARILVSQKRYDLARKEYEALLKLQPQDAVTLYSLGVLSAQANDARGAEKYLTRYMEALENQPGGEGDPSRILLLLGQLADERGDTEAAVKWLGQIEAQPGRNAAYLSAQIKLAQIAAKRGNLGEARKILARAETGDDEEKVQIVLTESQLMRDAGQAQDAYDILESALKRFPKNAHLLYDFSMAAEKLDKLAVMEKSLRQLIALEPDNQMAYNALGYSLADRNIRLTEAHQLIEKALKLAPGDAYIMDSMGWVHFRQGQFKEAEDWLRRAYQKRPEAEIAVHLGELLWVTGRKEDALKFWRDAAAKEPKNDVLKSTLKRYGVKL